jgi:uncharacterized protein YhbP (UPF0306 family)
MLSEILLLSTMTLATCDASGAPHAAPVYFVADEDLRLYFFSDPESQHSLDLRRDPRAAAAVYPECHGWQEIRGLQLHGEVRSVSPGAEWDAAWALYAAKFPFVNELKEAVMSNSLYVFTPRWVRLVDNRRGFGFKQEWDLP